jgi:hypothetical protein
MRCRGRGVAQELVVYDERVYMVDRVKTMVAKLLTKNGTMRELNRKE